MNVTISFRPTVFWTRVDSEQTMARAETLPALTTTFTPPASCSASWTYEAENLTSVSGGLLLQNAENTFYTNFLPPSFIGYGRVPSSIQVYRPGICPGGYATAGGFTFGGTTTEVCCPR